MADDDFFEGRYANIDGERVGLFGGKADPTIHLDISYNGGRKIATYALHPALIPIVQKFLGALSGVTRIGWLEAGTGKWRGE